MTHYGLRISEYRACRACTCALAPAADEYNLNVVDCNALSLSHAGLPSQSVGVWGVPPAAGGKRTAGGKRKMVFRGLPRASWKFILFFALHLGKTGVSVVEEEKFRGMTATTEVTHR